MMLAATSNYIVLATLCGVLCWRGVESFSIMSAKTISGNAVVPPAPQLLQFTEPTTNVTVVLVGAMHYNPTSVNLADRTIKSLGDRNMLGSVVVEACDIRWNKTMELYKEKPFLKKLLNNEMRTACDVAVSYGRPVVLGDQKINITTNAMKSSLKQTFIDLMTPPIGWKRFANELQMSWEETVPLGGEGYLSALSFFDPRLLLVLPISLFKYPLSFLVRDPLPTSIVLSTLFGLSYFDDPYTVEELMNNSIPLSEYIFSFIIAVLETVVFARVLLKPLLQERNVFLAESILDQCKLYASEDAVAATTAAAVNPPGGLFGLFTKQSKPKKQFEPSTSMYAPESLLLQNDLAEENGPNKTVVAVLGMAHCNGIMKLLKEQRV